MIRKLSRLLRRKRTVAPATVEKPAPKIKEVSATKPPFDPSDHTVPEVVAYLKKHPEETARILRAERLGKKRSGILRM